MRWTPERIRIWRSLTPAERDYDRVMAGSYPPLPGASQLETMEWQDYRDEQVNNSFEEHTCTCHINGPCSHCVDCSVCNCLACDDWHDTLNGETCPLLREI
jgi:hypothetical protein